MKNFFPRYLFIAILALCFAVYGCGNSCKHDSKQEEVKKMELAFAHFAGEYKAKIKPLTIDWYKAYFEASITGNPEIWKQVGEYEQKYNSIVSNKEDFLKLKKFKESGLVKDPELSRELLYLFNEYLSKQVDTELLNEMTKLQIEIEQKYNNFRAEVNGKKFSDNDVEETLKTSKNSDELRDVWLAHKKIGHVVAEDIIKLVKMRNQVAKSLGFNNYHEMSLTLSDQNPKDIEKLFDELDKLTKDAFKKLKDEMDDVLAKGCNIKPEELMPWHYQNRYFQEAPKIYDIDLDVYYKGKDLVQITKDYYKGLDLPIDDMAANSDLFEKPGKNQHAYCIDIDRDSKDIRVLCNVKDNADWQGTLLHEFGHALYEKYLCDDLYWSLKQPAHIFTTEAIAMIFGRFSKNPQWMHDVIGISKEDQDKIADVCNKTLRLEQLVFSRWSQVMYHFEKSMYANPDQDLNKLWWDLVEQYQMIKRPADRNEPDWATKTHIASSPCYYHNYHLGELLASQLYSYIVTNILNGKFPGDYSFANSPKVGDYLKEKVFRPGAKYYWNDMIEKATGEKLTAKYYAKQFVE